MYIDMYVCMYINSNCLGFAPNRNDNGQLIIIIIIIIIN